MWHVLNKYYYGLEIALIAACKRGDGASEALSHSHTGKWVQSSLALTKPHRPSSGLGWNMNKCQMLL
jgi:hypothetical protein